jgi:predicted dienelactone hydrolase
MIEDSCLEQKDFAVGVMVGLTQQNGDGVICHPERKHRLFRSRMLVSWVGGVFGAIALATPSFSAERMVLNYKEIEFQVNVQDVEILVNQGQLTNTLTPYATLLKPEQLKQIRTLFQQRFELDPKLVQQFTYSPLGEMFMRRFGEIFQSIPGKNGYDEVRRALTKASADPKGLNLLAVIKTFPSKTLHVDLQLVLEGAEELTTLTNQRDAIVAALRQQHLRAATRSPKVPAADLRVAGKWTVQKKSVTLDDTTRKLPEGRTRQIPLDVYWPQGANLPQSLPVVVISHGLGENRNNYAYLAKHLASYGFVVAIPEHPGSNAEKLQQAYSGFGKPPSPVEFLDRPKDITLTLDRLGTVEPSLKDRLNLQQVGVAGHSLGGYTAFALAGAELNFARLQEFCKTNRSLNISTLLQCRATELPAQAYPLQDPRVKSVIAINPVTSILQGQQGLAKLQVPVLMVGSGQDAITPIVPEQVVPFTWLTMPRKYLAVIDRATHFSAVGKSEQEEKKVLPLLPSMIGPSPELAQTYIKAMSVAFLKTTIAQDSAFIDYLKPAYVQKINHPPLQMSWTDTLTPPQLEAITSSAAASAQK